MIYISVVMFLLLPKIGLIDFSVLALIMAYLTSCKFFFVRYNRQFLLILFLWLLAFIVAIISYLYHLSIHSEILFKPLRQIAILFLLYGVFSNRRVDVVKLLSAILIACSINSLFVLIQYALDFLYPGQDFSYLYNPNFDQGLDVSFRKPGLYAGYPTSGNMSLFGVLIAIYLMVKNASVTNLFFFMVCFVTLFLSSRMSLLIGCLAIFSYLLYLSLFYPRVRYFTLYTAILLFGVVFLSFESGFVNPVTIEIMFEVFINASEGRGTQSGTALLASYSYPVDYISTLLVGNGSENNADNGRNVDAGVQTVLFTGGVFSLLIYHFLFCYYCLLCGRLPYFLNKESLLFLILFASLFVSNFKGVFLFGRGPGDVLALISIYYLSVNRNRVRPV